MCVGRGVVASLKALPLVTQSSYSNVVQHDLHHKKKVI